MRAPAQCSQCAPPVRSSSLERTYAKSWGSLGAETEVLYGDGMDWGRVLSPDGAPPPPAECRRPLPAAPGRQLRRRRRPRGQARQLLHLFDGTRELRVDRMRPRGGLPDLRPRDEALAAQPLLPAVPGAGSRRSRVCDCVRYIYLIHICNKILN